MTAPTPPPAPSPSPQPLDPEPGSTAKARTSRVAIGVAGGAVVLAVTIVAVVLAWPEGAPSAGRVARTDSDAPLVTDASHTPLPLAEDPRDFLAEFTGAVQNGDVDWLVGRLNPAVIQRYGEGQCRSYLRSSVIDPTMRLQLSTVTGPGTWEWSTDDRSTLVDEVYRIDAHRFLRGTETTGNLWLANVDGRLTWFADCGTPQRG